MTGDEVPLTYTMPLTPDGMTQEKERVLDIVQLWWAMRDLNPRLSVCKCCGISVGLCCYVRLHTNVRIDFELGVPFCANPYR